MKDYKSLETSIRELMAETSTNANSKTSPTKTNNRRSRARKVRLNKDGFVHGSGGYGTFENGGEVAGWGESTVNEEEAPVDPKDAPKPGEEVLREKNPKKSQGRRSPIEINPPLEPAPGPKKEKVLDESLTGLAVGAAGSALMTYANRKWHTRKNGPNYQRAYKDSMSSDPVKKAHGDEWFTRTGTKKEKVEEGFFDGKKKNRGLIPSGFGKRVKAAAKRRRMGADALHNIGRNGLGYAGGINLIGGATRAALGDVAGGAAQAATGTSLLAAHSLTRRTGISSKPDYSGTRTGRLQRAASHFKEGVDESVAAALLVGGAMGALASGMGRGRNKAPKGKSLRSKHYGPRKPKMTDKAAVTKKLSKGSAMNASASADADDTIVRHARFKRLGILPERMAGRHEVKNYISREHYLTLKRMHNSGATDTQLVRAHKELKHKYPVASNNSNAAGAHFMMHVHESNAKKKKSDEQLMAMIKKINPYHKDTDPTIGIKGSMGFDPKRGPQTKYTRMYRSKK